MAVFTRDEHEGILKKIMESPDVETSIPLIQSLRTNFDEQQTAITSAQNEAKTNLTKYETIKQQYTDAFFSSKSDGVVKSQTEDTKEDTKPKSYDDLFKSKGEK